MALRLRQIALVGADLGSIEPDIEQALGATVCFRDPGVGVFGLHNALFRLDDTFLEVVSPTQEGTTAGRLLDKRRGDGGYMVLFETDDLGLVRSRLDQAGVRIVFEAVTDGIVGLHLHPADTGGAIISIDGTDTWGEWPWGGPEWRTHPPATDAGRICGATLQADDPSAMAHRWAEVLDRPVETSDSSGGVPTVSVDDATLRFVAVADGRGEGLSEVSCKAAGANRPGSSVAVCGVTINFVA